MRSHILLWIGACVLAGCGGGGGGNDSPPVQRLTLDRQQVTSAVSSSASVASAVSITGTISGSPASIFVVIEHTTNGIHTITTPTTSGNSATAHVVFKPGRTVGHGTYQDTITVRACRDSQCTQQFAGSPTTITTTLKVGVQVSPAPIALQAVEGAPAAPQNISVDVYTGSGSWASTIAHTTGSGWLTAQPASGSALPATMVLNASAVTAGTYTAQLTISATPTNASTEDRAVPVTYTVQSLLNAAAVAPFSVTAQQPSSGQFRETAVTSRDANRQTPWSAVSRAAWLRVATSTGTTASNQPLRIELEPSEVARLPNGAYVGTVVITPGLAGTSPIEVPVQLTLNRAHVATVAPYVEKANVQRPVILRGSRFNDAPIASVRFGTHDAASFTVESDTKIHATHPALPAGRYAIEVRTESGLIESRAELVVKGSSGYAPVSNQPAPHYGSVSVFDKERDTCFTGAFPTNERIVSLQKNGAYWDVQQSPERYPGTSDLALTADGRELLVFVGTGVIAHLDPVTLIETRRSTASADQLGPDTGNALHGTVVTDAGTILTMRATRYIRYQPANGTFSLASPVIDYNVVSFPSGAGNRFVWGRGMLDSRAFGLMDSDSVVSTPFYTSTNSLSDIESDRFGMRWAFAGETSHSNFAVTIVDATGAVRGTIPGSMSRGPIAMDPDGNTLYVGNGSNIDVFDLSVVPANGIYLPSRTLPVATQSSIPFPANPELSANEDALIDCTPNGVWSVALP